MATGFRFRMRGRLTLPWGRIQPTAAGIRRHNTNALDLRGFGHAASSTHRMAGILRLLVRRRELTAFGVCYPIGHMLRLTVCQTGVTPTILSIAFGVLHLFL